MLLPAKAGIHGPAVRGADKWVPAFAGIALAEIVKTVIAR
jgi:hypothetical protein